MKLKVILICVCLASLLSCLLAEIVIENEPREVVRAHVHSAMPIINRLAQRIRETSDPVQDKSLLSAESSIGSKAKPDVYGEFSHKMMGNPWRDAYEKCADSTLKVMQDMLMEYWNWNGVKANQGFVHLFEYMGEVDKKSILRLRKLATALKAAKLPDGNANADIRKYGLILAELMKPFENFDSVQQDSKKKFDQVILTRNHLTDAAFKFLVPITAQTWTDASTVISTHFTKQAAPKMDAARLQLDAKITALNNDLKLQLPVGGPETHYCTTFLGIATVATAAFHHLRSLAKAAPANYYCNWQDEVGPSSIHDEVFFLPEAPNTGFMSKKSDSGVEIRFHANRLSTFITNDYETSFLAKKNTFEAAARALDENSQYFKDAVKAYDASIANTPTYQTKNKIGTAAKDSYVKTEFEKGFLHKQGVAASRGLISVEVAKKLQKLATDPMVVAEVDKVTTAKLYRCLNE